MKLINYFAYFLFLTLKTLQIVLSALSESRSIAIGSGFQAKYWIHAEFVANDKIEWQMNK